MDAIIQKFIDLIERYWHKPVILIFIELFIVTYLFHHLNLSNPKNYTIFNFVIIFLIAFAIIIAWYFLTKPEKTKKGKIGFVIAIKSENNSQRKLVEADLVRSIQEILDRSRTIADFQIITLPKYIGEKINDIDTATKYIKKCNAPLLMYGDTRKRKSKGKEVYIFRLRQMILHRPISKGAEDELTIELSEIFPGNLRISVDEELVGLEVASNWMGEAAKYFIAMAALIGGNFDLSEALFLEIIKSTFLKNIKGQRGVARIRTNAIKRICELYDIRSNHYVNGWRNNHEKTMITLLGEELDKQKRLCGETYTWLVRKAIWHFIEDDNVTEAMKILHKCRGNTDAAWRYSLAFLSAFNGNLANAERIYDIAFTKPAHEGISLEVEEFIQWTIEKHPEKYQLYYCLGYLNEHLKNDDLSARRDYDLFLAGHDVEVKYPDQVKHARKYISDI